MENQQFTVVSKSEGTMSEIFYMTDKDFTADYVTGLAAKIFSSLEEAEQFVSEFNNGDNDLYVEEL